jgi:hypothetical protein
VADQPLCQLDATDRNAPSATGIKAGLLRPAWPDAIGAAVLIGHEQTALLLAKSGCAPRLFSQIVSTRSVLSSPAAKNKSIAVFQKL